MGGVGEIKVSKHLLSKRRIITSAAVRGTGYFYLKKKNSYCSYFLKCFIITGSTAHYRVVSMLTISLDTLKFYSSENKYIFLSGGPCCGNIHVTNLIHESIYSVYLLETEPGSKLWNSWLFCNSVSITSLHSYAEKRPILHLNFSWANSGNVKHQL